MNRKEEIVVLVHSCKAKLNDKVTYYSNLSFDSYVDGHTGIKKIIDEIDTYIEEYKSLKKEPND